MVMEPLPIEERTRSASAGGAEAIALRLEGALACTHSGCDATTGIACAYVDRRSHPCRTAWCPSHRLVLGTDVYCRRHAGVVSALWSTDAPLNTSFPDLDNRAPSLVAWIVRGIDADVWRLLLDELAEDHAGQLIAEPVTLVFTAVERRRAWERSWKVVNHTGIVRRVSVLVDELDDTEVVVRVGSHVVATAVPPWIQHRRNHEHVDEETDELERAAFNARLTMAIADGLSVERARDEEPWMR